MKSIVLTLSILIGFFAYTQTIELFTLNQYTTANNTKTGFISLSDKYDNEKFLDSIGILPKNASNFQRVPLASIFRKRLLEGTKSTEKDTVYLYNYETNALVKTPVSSIKTIAKINDYANEEDLVQPANPNDFMYGMEVNNQVLKELGDVARVFVYIGPSNPFKLQKLQPFVWKKISDKEFPFSKMNNKQQISTPIKDLKFHYYKSENYQYFVVSDMFSRHLVILDLIGNKVNEIVFSNSESSSIAKIVEGTQYKTQFVGTLFESQPEVFLGFETIVFSCNKIYFVYPTLSPLTINCDNRH